jgi:hypothetical protein
VNLAHCLNPLHGFSEDSIQEIFADHCPHTRRCLGIIPKFNLEASGSGCVMVEVVVAPSEFELIKNRATIVKCERPWTGTGSGGVDVGKEGALPL